MIQIHGKPSPPWKKKPHTLFQCSLRGHKDRVKPSWPMVLLLLYCAVLPEIKPEPVRFLKILQIKCNFSISIIAGGDVWGRWKTWWGKVRDYHIKTEIHPHLSQSYRLSHTGMIHSWLCQLRFRPDALSLYPSLYLAGPLSSLSWIYFI